ncbi:hypothetical protein R1sor_012303 [Riccia sorocarpa]|uniref:Uncharacterized protein n=1 Tax=Riccia sorocarpa TaxID=122646 RepID=A0ABD3I637_9MARC
MAIFNFPARFSVVVSRTRNRIRLQSTALDRTAIFSFPARNLDVTMRRPKIQAWKRKGKEKLPIIEFPPDDAAEEVCETISNFIQDVGDEEGTSKRQKVDNPGSSQVPQSTALALYRAHDQSAIQLSSGENTILTFEELAMLTRNEVFPFLNLDRLEDEGIVEIDPKLFGPGGGGDTLKVNISDDGLRRQLQFRNSDDSDRVVPPLNIENEFLQRHGRATLKDAWRLVAKWFNYTNETFRNEWCSVQQPQMLQIEARNAFEETKVVWDSERGKLIAEQERLKNALHEVQQREEALRQEREELQGAALEASLREEALRKEHESLQQEYSRQKDEWEAKNQKLSEEIEVLHEDRKRITSKADLYFIPLAFLSTPIRNQAGCVHS